MSHGSGHLHSSAASLAAPNQANKAVGGAGANNKEFKKHNNIFSRVYEEMQPLLAPNLSASKKKLPLSKTTSTPIKLIDQTSTFKPQVICGAQLSVWHDTAGPVIEQLWTVPGDDEDGQLSVSNEFQAFMARQTLCGLDTKIVSEEMRFNIYPEQGFMIPSIIFNAKYHEKITKFALSIYLDITKLHIYQHCHDFISDRMSLLASIILTNYCNSNYDLTKFTPELLLVCVNIDKVFSSSYPTTDISQTFFIESHPPAQPEYDFIVKAITSHMHTGGSTVVIGSNDKVILKWLDTLYLFLTPNERNVSSRVLSHEFVPDLIIQGILDVSLKTLEERIPYSLRPSTVIDTDRNEVYQTEIQYQYTCYRDDFLVATAIFKKQLPPEKETKILCTFTQPSVYVRQMLNEVFSLPLNYREIYLVHYMRLLLRKASFVVSFTQSINSNLGINYAKKVKSELNLPSESDVYLLFGIAEKLQLNLFMSAIKLEQIEKVFQVFESF
ncbi:hypothetical protein SAMD00019534_007980 [Acytostelium subglobosum LB1]|uniref:hypothetical protein n=1 Tax=Acytostelium subglobosum LB1 TaxID=1410327 RepID=UPI000645070F|nr:hypothetical protein SAMD00019534_007980 [Acytostelium subglobosum LB1]GAM17623.1 hypothetical protein SAMD00019534_007980 [Acytostelium subglobosum LB1]|eukprot:XP_012758219.1 hypothetical protein SAMD00019534_007980 [Acytostelium subglobosum LB1]